MRTRHLVGLLLLLTIPTTTLAGGTRHADEPLAFSPVPDYGASLDDNRGRDPGYVRETRPVLRQMLDRPVAVDHAVRQTVRVQRTAPRPLSGHHATGTASWYCCTRGHPSGLYAAAGPGLRQGDWRGRLVSVRAGGRVVRVRLIDWCACPKRVIDLYPAAFSRLGPLSRGLLNVKVTW
jgi:rare lipoprotein A (peptidoglycan hydrolase)